MEKNFEEKMIEIYAYSGLHSSKIFRKLAPEYNISKSDFFHMLEKLTKNKRIIRKPSKYNVRCSCCKNVFPNKEIIGNFCEKCYFLDKYKNKQLINEKKYNGDDEYD
jgi:hypothetical protein